MLRCLRQSSLWTFFREIVSIGMTETGSVQQVQSSQFSNCRSGTWPKSAAFRVSSVASCDRTMQAIFRPFVVADTRGRGPPPLAPSRRRSWSQPCSASLSGVAVNQEPVKGVTHSFGPPGADFVQDYRLNLVTSGHSARARRDYLNARVNGFSATPAAHGLAVKGKSSVASFSPCRLASATRCASVVSFEPVSGASLPLTSSTRN